MMKETQVKCLKVTNFYFICLNYELYRLCHNNASTSKWLLSNCHTFLFCFWQWLSWLTLIRASYFPSLMLTCHDMIWWQEGPGSLSTTICPRPHLSLTFLHGAKITKNYRVFFRKSRSPNMLHCEHIAYTWNTRFLDSCHVLREFIQGVDLFATPLGQFTISYSTRSLWKKKIREGSEFHFPSNSL